MICGFLFDDLSVVDDDAVVVVFVVFGSSAASAIWLWILWICWTDIVRLNLVPGSTSSGTSLLFCEIAKRFTVESNTSFNSSTKLYQHKAIIMTTRFLPDVESVDWWSDSSHTAVLSDTSGNASACWMYNSSAAKSIEICTQFEWDCVIYDSLLMSACPDAPVVSQISRIISFCL